jgi:LysR family transcriptional regulator, glycine cleavage system transcriptional activator
MKIKRPPLRALIAFEAVARHLSFKLAAEELFITRSAVSHQIAALEEFLGLQLFTRNTRDLRVTPAGQQYLRSIRDALTSIDEATSELVSPLPTEILTIQTNSSFGPSILLPHLADFRAIFANLDIKVRSTHEAPDFRDGSLDIAICYGLDDWPGCTVETLAVERVIPLCSPSLVTRSRPLNDPSQLRDFTLIHTERNLITWRMWLRALQVHEVDPHKGLVFAPSYLSIGAAVQGLGVALESDLLARSELEHGRLIVPFKGDRSVENLSYSLVVPESKAAMPRIVDFKKWLIERLSQAPKALPLQA